jgi:Tfp pilus assembly protein PilO
MAETSKIKPLNQQNNLRYIYNTRRYLIWSGFFVLLSIALIFASLVPQITSITDLYSDLIEENLRLAQLRIKVAQLIDSNDSLIITNLDNINQTLPSKKPLLELLTSLNTVGNQSQVRFNDISLSPGKISTESAETTESSRSRTKSSVTNTGYETLYLDVTVTGPISNINRFLTEIERIAPFTTITAMTLNEKSLDNTNIDSDDAVFEAKLTISTYFFQKSISVNIDAKLPELSASQREIIDNLQEFTYPSIDEQSEIRGGGLQNLFPNIQSAL